MQGKPPEITLKYAWFYIALMFLLSAAPLTLVILLDRLPVSINLAIWSNVGILLTFMIFLPLVPLYLFLGFRYSFKSFEYIGMLLLLGVFIDACRFPIFNIVTHEYRLTGWKQFVGRVVDDFIQNVTPGLLAALVCYFIGCFVHWLIKMIRVTIN